MRWRVLVFAIAASAGVAPRPAWAGMPSPFPMLTEVGHLRFEAISFFLLLFLLCAWGVRGIWNTLARDFPGLPHLSFSRALGVVALWGLLFLLVLTMISGARELMTPGAWKPNGVTSRLADAPQPRTPEEQSDIARRRKLEYLRLVLWQYAHLHGGHFPPGDDVSEVPAEAWQVPDPSGMRYLYAGQRQRADEGDAPVAYEPGLFGRERLVLRADGAIQTMTLAEIRRALEPGKP